MVTLQNENGKAVPQGYVGVEFTMRMTRSVDVLYWRNINGNTIAETDGDGSTSNAAYHEYVFFAGRRVARSDPSSGEVYYFFVDHLGSTRVMTDDEGNVLNDSGFYPFGDLVRLVRGTREIVFRAASRSRSGAAAIEIIDHTERTLEVVHFK